MPGPELPRRTPLIGVRHMPLIAASLVLILIMAAVETIVVRHQHGSAAGHTGHTASATGRTDAKTLHSSAARLPPGTVDTDVPAHPAEAVGGLLTARATAIRDGNRAGWLAPVDPSNDAQITGFRTAQGQDFDRIRSLRPVIWSYRVVGGSTLPIARRAVLGPAAWLADVQLDYQLTPGAPMVRHEQFLTFVRYRGDWRIAADTDGETTQDVWDLGPIAHASASRCLVVGAQARQAQIDQLAAECGQAAGTVDVAWGTSWNRRTVLTVPNSLTQLAVLLGRTTGQTGGGAGSVDATAGLDNTAAVTIGPADGAADEVLINGAAFDELSALGRRVVLTHELVHVATRATGSRYAPTWLEEGFADYVAYQHSGLTDQQVASDALQAVRAGRTPTRLPATDDFNAAGTGAAAAYGLAWVAVQLIAAKAGSTLRMKSFYQQAGAPAVAGSPSRSGIVDAALASVGLHDTVDFVRLWQARLTQLAN